MQSKKLSALESTVQAIMGVTVGFLIQKYIFPLIGIHITTEQNIKAVILFFVASLVRHYLLRRVFNFIKEKYEKNS